MKGTAVPEEFKALVRQLDADVKELAHRYHRRRVESVVLWFVVIGMIVLGSLYAALASSRRDYTDQQIRELACVIIAPNPDTIPVVKAKRAQYHCPPYNPAVARRYRPTATTTATATRTLAPRSTPTVVHVVPGPTRTVYVRGPVRTVTVTVPPGRHR